MAWSFSYAGTSRRAVILAFTVIAKGQFQGRFDAGGLEHAVKEILRDRRLGPKIRSWHAVQHTRHTMCLASYGSPHSDNSDLLDSTTTWQACRATSAATTFFDPIAIGPFGEEFVDGARTTR
ncbi:hypothetical protein B0T26DRAFT_680951 [Lasiosphaeria miniovina]|uniref:PNPLA domain-containing protein n=1 Tax=Lasiosphaeria miniovina TaxID=1954250 RepID=A0AA39ZT66_9PEZI|nr:uncharacterized protein B0T26DRAFT_680951 [Lasiosphaeria miniovina]KAK0703246.1 hypothetical protein B0T26DRAFT_680951 [Lasiosphaeria miniovina]